MSQHGTPPGPGGTPREVRLDTSDDLYDDVLSSPPATGTDPAAPASDPTADPGPASAPASPSSVDWPDLDMDDEYAGRPDWQQWRRLQEQADAAARAAEAERAAEAARAAEAERAESAKAAKAAKAVEAAKAAAAAKAAVAPSPAPAPAHATPAAASTPPYQAPPSYPPPTRRGRRRRRAAAARSVPATTPSRQPAGSRTKPASARTPSRSARRPRWIPVVVIAVVLGGVGVQNLADHFGSGDRGSSSSSSSSRDKPEPALGDATTVTPTGATVPSVKDPKTVRLEVLANAGSVGRVSYSSDNKDTTRAQDVSLPWAVEAPLSSGNEYVSVSGSDETPYSDGKSKTPVSTVICRIYLDGVKVSEMVGRGYASCDTSVDRFRTTRTNGDGEKLAATSPVTPTPTPLPTLSGSAPTSVIFEAYSSAASADVSFGNTTTRNRKEDQSLPAAWRTAMPAGVDYFGATVSDYSGDDKPMMLCRLIVEGVTVIESVEPTSATCSLSTYFLTRS